MSVLVAAIVGSLVSLLIGGLLGHFVRKGLVSTDKTVDRLDERLVKLEEAVADLRASTNGKSREERDKLRDAMQTEIGKLETRVNALKDNFYRQVATCNSEKVMKADLDRLLRQINLNLAVAGSNFDLLQQKFELSERKMIKLADQVVRLALRRSGGR